MYQDSGKMGRNANNIMAGAAVPTGIAVGTFATIIGYILGIIFLFGFIKPIFNTRYGKSIFTLIVGAAAVAFISSKYHYIQQKDAFYLTVLFTWVAASGLINMVAINAIIDKFGLCNTTDKIIRSNNSSAFIGVVVAIALYFLLEYKTPISNYIDAGVISLFVVIATCNYGIAMVKESIGPVKADFIASNKDMSDEKLYSQIDNLINELRDTVFGIESIAVGIASAVTLVLAYNYYYDTILVIAQKIQHLF